nr:peptidylprolyl isomerase [Desulfosarcina alkanivorans]
MPRVKLITSQGEIVLELDRTAAPRTVDNFLDYVGAGFYDGTIFHRVISGFMIQGGGFDAQMNRRPTRPPIPNEADNRLPNRTGTIAMARTSDPHSATAQFFINVKDNGFLDHRGKTAKGWGYCVFGKVVSGMNVVRAIEKVPTTSHSGMRDVPRTPVLIQRMSVVPATAVRGGSE